MEKIATPIIMFGTWALAQATALDTSSVPVSELTKLGPTGVALAVFLVLLIRREQQLVLMNDQYRSDIQKLTEKMTTSMDKQAEAVQGLRVEVHELTKYEEVLKMINRGMQKD